jgi:hypothetical protein
MLYIGEGYNDIVLVNDGKVPMSSLSRDLWTVGARRELR